MRNYIPWQSFGRKSVESEIGQREMLAIQKLYSKVFAVHQKLEFFEVYFPIPIEINLSYHSLRLILIHRSPRLFIVMYSSSSLIRPSPSLSNTLKDSVIFSSMLEPCLTTNSIYSSIWSWSSVLFRMCWFKMTVFYNFIKGNTVMANHESILSFLLAL